MVQRTKHIVWTIALFAISTKTIPFTENKIYLFFLRPHSRCQSRKIKKAYLQALVQNQTCSRCF